MSKIGYACVSSKEQNLDRKLVALEGVSKVFSDKLSGKTTKRAQLKAMLDYIRDGDVIVVTELDRLGRNNKDLTEIMESERKRIKERQAQVIKIAKRKGNLPIASLNFHQITSSWPAL